MGEVDLPPQANKLRSADAGPGNGKVALYAAGGGFIGALIAIIVARLLAGPCCPLA
ncbi:MAG TPA: hypothetical protein VKZ85_04495 [Woeseiaceae bacterium]|jgi:hypothetical protein|nr:hypothetical protein [Woeseiaceae bacterium]